MQLGSNPATTDADDLAAALAARARDAGQRPAVSLLRPDGRHEQGFASLAQWAAKGAHLLQVDHDLGPGDGVLVDVPAGWTLAAVAAAVWWTGAAVVLAGPDDPADGVAVAVVDERRAAPDLDEVLEVGTGRDGGPSTGRGLAAWVEEVQAFPDQPPAARATASGVAVRVGGVARTHAEVLDLAGRLGEPGPLGLTVAGTVTEPWLALLAVAARPLATGRATVVLDGVDAQAAAGDRVRSWLPT